MVKKLFHYKVRQQLLANSKRSMMNKKLLVVLTFIAFSCKDKEYTKEQTIIDRIEFVYNLKKTVDETTWATFNDKAYDLPLVYFTDTSSYIANPTEKFLATFKSELVFQNQTLKIYKTNNRLDTVPFHMETGMTLGDSTSDFNYHSPFMMCSSYEETYKTIPQVLSTEKWTTMVMHEYFHGYQYKHKSYMNYYEKEIVQIQPDSLIRIYKNNTWFKKSIDQENQLLVKAISEPDTLKTNNLIAEFFALRNKRRNTVIENLKFDISKYEKCYETMEGTARYIEYSLYTLYAASRANSNVLKSDTAFKSFESFRNYSILNDQWLYLTEKTSYFYAIGFNMARLLDKLKIDYKTRLFKEGPLSLEAILLEKLNSK